MINLLQHTKRKWKNEGGCNILMAINPNGKLEEGTKISELINYLNEHLNFHGDSRVVFMNEGNDTTSVQFDHFKEAIIIYVD